MSKVYRRVEVQASIEGETLNIKCLRILLKHLDMHGDFLHLVDVKYHRYGKLSYECHTFYYLKNHVIAMVSELHNCVMDELTKEY